MAGVGGIEALAKYLLRKAGFTGADAPDVNLANLINGEDPTTNRMLVESRWSSFNTTGGTASVKMTGANAFVHGILVSNVTAGKKVTVREGILSGTAELAVLLFPANDVRWIPMDRPCSAGMALWLQPDDAGLNVTVFYRGTAPA